VDGSGRVRHGSRGSSGRKERISGHRQGGAFASERRLLSSEEKKARSRFVLENGEDLETFVEKGNALGLLLRGMAELLLGGVCLRVQGGSAFPGPYARSGESCRLHARCPVESVFRWKSVVETKAEHLLVATTTERLFPVLRERLLAAHSYDFR
jgi:hypothetical protein